MARLGLLDREKGEEAFDLAVPVMVTGGMRTLLRVADFFMVERALAGVGNTRTPMYIRLLTLPTNIGLNAVLIFGFGPFPELGVAGAAWGSAIANTLAAALFTAVLLSGRFSVRLPFGGTQWDWSIATEIVRVGLPLAGTRISRTVGRFPFLMVLTTLGTPVVAAYAISRRVMLLALMPAWGYSTASSTLVGQSIGAGNDAEADAYGWQTLRIALATQLLIGAVLFAAARPLAVSFGTEHVDLTVELIRIFGIGVAAFSVSRTMRGGLRGAGDTRWPFYGTVVGTYLFKLPVAVLAIAPGVALFSVGGWAFAPGLGLGLIAVYVAIVGDMYVRAAVNVFRFWTGEWKRIARESDVGAGTGTD